MTDEARPYEMLGDEFASTTRSTTALASTCAASFHTNTVEGYFSILKRGINGMYHHVSQQHLQRYLGRVRFSLQRARRPWRERCGAHGQISDGHRGQTPQ